MKELKQMGEITVKAFHINNVRHSGGGVAQKRMSGVDKVPEKALKGRTLSHQSR